MCASSVVELPFPKIDDNFYIIFLRHVRDFWGVVKSCQEGVQFVGLSRKHGLRIVCDNLISFIFFNF